MVWYSWKCEIYLALLILKHNTFFFGFCIVCGCTHSYTSVNSPVAHPPLLYISFSAIIYMAYPLLNVFNSKLIYTCTKCCAVDPYDLSPILCDSNTASFCWVWNFLCFYIFIRMQLISALWCHSFSFCCIYLYYFKFESQKCMNKPFCSKIATVLVGSFFALLFSSSKHWKIHHSIWQLQFMLFSCSLLSCLAKNICLFVFLCKVFIDLHSVLGCFFVWFVSLLAILLF